MTSGWCTSLTIKHISKRKLKRILKPTKGKNRLLWLVDIREALIPRVVRAKLAGRLPPTWVVKTIDWCDKEIEQARAPYIAALSPPD